MQPDPDSRFQNFIQVFDEQKNAIGFHLPENDFFFKYEQDGGWYDEKGNYYNVDGILQEQAHSEEQNQDDDEEQNQDQEEIIDQFQQMLAQEQQGIIKNKSLAKQTQQSNKQPLKQKINYLKQSQKLLENYKEGKLVRNNLSNDLVIFFKMRSKFFTNIKTLQVEKQSSIQKQNQKVKQIQNLIQQQRKKLITSNKWLDGDQVLLDFSGCSSQQNKYDRYWFGKIKANPSSFLNIWNQIKNSQQFFVLEHKTYFSFKSKFFAKEKMQKNIEDMKKEIQFFSQNEIVQIILGNLPQQFSISFVFDLLDFVGVSYIDIIQILILDEFSARLKVSKRAALLITNLQGYNHDLGQYIQIEIKSAKKQILQKRNCFKIEIDADFKVNIAELNDTMAFQLSKTDVMKLLEKGQKYRWIIGEKCLKRAVMFRGPTINIESIYQVCTQKDII